MQPALDFRGAVAESPLAQAHDRRTVALRPPAGQCRSPHSETGSHFLLVEDRLDEGSRRVHRALRRRELKNSRGNLGGPTITTNGPRIHVNNFAVTDASA